MLARIVAVLLVLGLVGQAAAATRADIAASTETAALVDSLDEPFLVEVLAPMVELPRAVLVIEMPACGEPAYRLHVPSVFRPPR